MRTLFTIIFTIAVLVALVIDLEFLETFSIMSLLCAGLLIYLIYLVKKLIDKFNSFRTSKSRPMSAKQAEEIIALLKKNSEEDSENK